MSLSRTALRISNSQSCPGMMFLLVQPRVHAIGFQAGVEGADGVTVRVGVAEEDFEGAVWLRQINVPFWWKIKKRRSSYGASFGF